MRTRELIHQAALHLAESGLGKVEAARDSRLLMQHASGFDRASLIARENDFLPANVAERFQAAIARRGKGEPVSRIAGSREFYGLRFEVSPAVLDPRPETELLVERVLADLPGHGAPFRFADIGTGSGAIAIALLTHLPAAHCVAVDISGEALEIAVSNARTHGVEDRLEARRGNFLDGLEGPFDFIVSNPPYIPRADIADLAREVREHDPHAALDGGEDGLDAYRALLAGSGALLKPGGRLYLEIGIGQAGAIADIAGRSGWRVEGIAVDLAGIERIVTVGRG